jgi:hypothetical protein
MSVKKEKITFKYGSKSYKVLGYLKMANRPVTPRDVVNIFRGKFRHAGDAKSTLEVLVRNGCAEKTSNETYMITEKGLNIMGLFGKKQHLVLHRSSLS